MGDFLKNLLKKKGVKAAAFAREIDKRPEVVRRWFSYKDFKSDLIWLLLNRFDIPPTDFFPINKELVFSEGEILQMYRSEKQTKEALEFLLMMDKTEEETVPWENINPEIADLLLRLEAKLRKED